MLRKKKKQELKEAAQFELLSSMMHSFSAIENSDELLKEMDKQARRVEKLFGYEPESWMRGS